jgi:F0F1-type ATP synthase membrane subunit c/vacuolar-type H+-ATPase subunit K
VEILVKQSQEEDVMSLGLDEAKAKDVETETQVDAQYRSLRVIWLGILASLVSVFVMTRVIETPAVKDNNALFWMLWALGFMTFGASFVLKHKLLKQAALKQKTEPVRGAYVLAFALCEATGLLGLVAYFATGIQHYYLFFVLSGFGLLLHKPQRDDLLGAVSGGGVWGTRKND